MALVTSYHVLIYGSPGGYQDCRAQVTMMNGATVVGIIRFVDPDMAMGFDEQREDGRIYSYMPIHTLGHVVDLLRNEKPMNFYYAQGRAFLGTRELEPVGEGESAS